MKYGESTFDILYLILAITVGILILIVRHLDDLQKRHGFEYLGFCGRDAHYLQLLYERFKHDCGETPAPNDYLYYSRRLIKNSRAEVEKYFRAKIQNRNALLIDLLGTGSALYKFRGGCQLFAFNLLSLEQKIFGQISQGQGRRSRELDFLPRQARRSCRQGRRVLFCRLRRNSCRAGK